MKTLLIIVLALLASEVSAQLRTKDRSVIGFLKMKGGIGTRWKKSNTRVDSIPRLGSQLFIRILARLQRHALFC